MATVLQSHYFPRVNPRHDYMSPVGTSMYCSPHPAALHIAPAARLRGFCLYDSALESYVTMKIFDPKVVMISPLLNEADLVKTAANNLFAMKKRNFIGRQVGKRRNELDWTQDYLADRLEDAGWLNAKRSTVSKIEDGSLRIDLTQLFYLAVALRVHPIHFLPKMDWSKPVKAQIYSP